MPGEPRVLTADKLAKGAKERRLTRSLETPLKIREFQRKLYAKAKQEPGYRFYLLYDKIHRWDILEHAYELAKANGGAPGVDQQSFPGIEAAGRDGWLASLRKELIEKTYRPKPVRRVMIPKPGGGERPLGIPTVRDRVAQTATKLVLEPIWEAIWSRMPTATARGAVPKTQFGKCMSSCAKVIPTWWMRI
jgi:RNA-directed DNA polymerase